MATPTQKPIVYLRLERDGVVRVMFKSPFPDGQAATAPDLINRLRVYHATHLAAEGGLTFLGDLTLAFSPSTPVYELTFVPGKLGVFAFSFVNLLDEEGPISNVGKYVYLSAVRTKATLQARCLGDLSGDDLLAFMSDASDEFEMYTGNRFYPRFFIKPLTGNNALDFPLDEPIVEITSVRFRSEAVTGPPIIDPSHYRVFNRHIASRNAFVQAFPTKVDGNINFPGDGSGGMVHPDDREAPMISFLSSNRIAVGQRNTRVDPAGLRHSSLLGESYYSSASQFYGFAEGRQNILVDGFFGYLEPDLSTPSMVSVATEMLALRQAVLRFGSPTEALDVMRQHRVIMEKTDGHTIMFKSQDPNATPFTGDLFVDQIIARYFRPMGGCGI